MTDTPDKDGKDRAAQAPDGGATQAPAPSRKPGFFARLFGLAVDENDIVVAVAPFLDAGGADHASTVAAAFEGIEGLRARVLKEKSPLTAEDKRSDQLPTACAQALNWLTKHNADVVLWGDAPPTGSSLYIYFAASPPVDADPAGILSPFQALNLPLGFDKDTFGGLLRAAALAAMHINHPVKRQRRNILAAEALGQATKVIDHLPKDFTMREKAAANAMYANALAAFGHLFGGIELHQRAVKAYTEAIKGTLRSESQTNWAYLQRNLGAVLQIIGERSDDIHTLEQAGAAYRSALEVFNPDSTPFPWATSLNRLGEVLYRLDIKSGEMSGIKEALSFYQSTLKVLSRTSTPMLWSETMNNLAQAAQVLGRELSNPDVLGRAVEACRQALTVRKRNIHPTLWAATQNNMGSAIFLQGRLTGDDKYYQKALDAFEGAHEVYQQLGLTRMVELTEKNIAHARQRLPEHTDKGDPGDQTEWWLIEDDDELERARDGADAPAQPLAPPPPEGGAKS
ncbi:MAG: tetratricopeptide repeat protein [Alphaproteobacteria bacterium]|nr:tetratricopeptide repeat protein [Alphaproteobacteria bacterium]